MTAIITDKQCIAKQIALSLNMDVKTGNNGYFQGHGFMLVWSVGEIISLFLPEDYGKIHLAKDDLPFIPKSFMLAVCKKKSAKRPVTDKAAAGQLNIIKKVFDQCSSIIVATNAGEEGELNFRRIYLSLKCNKPFKRLWINSLTAKAIQEGFNNLREGSLYDNLYIAADLRAKADYLIDVNASRAFSLATRMVNHPLGRMQTPTLAMICRRFIERREFVSTRFFEHYITLEKDGLTRQFKMPGTMSNRKNAEKILKQMKTCREAQITKVESQTGIQPAPLLYNLTALQKDANTLYGFSAAKTMEITRKLYEEKLISYPLTDSRHVPENVFSAIAQIIRQTAAHCELTGCLDVMDWDSLNRRSVGNTDTFEHHALIPTGIYPGCQPKDDKLIYHLIAKRTLEAFAPDCQKEVTLIKVVCGNFVFESKMSAILYPSWRLIQNRKEDREENEVRQDDVFPAFTKGENVCISAWSLLTKKTLPEPLYTEASLLSAMEKACLGTVETQTGIIETLFSCNYIERRGESLIPAQKGLAVYNRVKNMRIADMELAGSWEKMLSDIRRGEQNADTFMTKFEIFTKQVTAEILNIQKTTS
jgi:DNA topoisomerase-3